MTIQNGQSIDFSKLDMIKTQTAPPHYQAEGETLLTSENVNLSDADFVRDGADLVLEFDFGGQIVIDDYFSGANAPTLQGSNGSSLPEALVQSFLKSGTTYEVAENYTLNDASPIGAIEEMAGQVTIARVDGSIEVAQLGSSIYQGDIVETDASGAVNIVFVDETSFAVSGNAKLAIDEYVFDPASESGTTNFSVLKGMFVFTSGLIGRDDPDDVMIETPMGSIGIRGTIIAGDVDSGEITVVEGAVVLHDFSGNEITLADQFSTAQFKSQDGTIDDLGQMSAADVASKFDSVSVVAPDLFSSIEDAAKESVQPEETQAERESGVDDTGTQESGNETSGDGGHINMKDAPIAEDGGALAGEDGHELSDELMENTETLLMDTGKEKALMGDDGQLDQQELMDILTKPLIEKTDLQAKNEQRQAEQEARTQEELEQEAAQNELSEAAQSGANSIAPDEEPLIINGTSSNDHFSFNINSTEHPDIINGHDGNDTLHLHGNGSLNFANVDALKSVETIHLGNGNQEITLNPSMILSNVGEDGILQIDGDSGDSINIDFSNDLNWSTTGIDGNNDGYIEYHHNNGGTITTLLVGTAIDASNVTGII